MPSQAFTRPRFRELLAIAVALDTTVEDFTYCPCALPEGWFSIGGFHHRRADQQFLYAQEKWRFWQAGRQGWTTGALRQAWAEWLDQEERAGHFSPEGMHISWMPYVGLSYAVEQCPIDRARRRARVEDDQAEKREQRKRYDRRT